MAGWIDGASALQLQTSNGRLASWLSRAQSRSCHTRMLFSGVPLPPLASRGYICDLFILLSLAGACELGSDVQRYTKRLCRFKGHLSHLSGHLSAARLLSEFCDGTWTNTIYFLATSTQREQRANILGSTGKRPTTRREQRIEDTAAVRGGCVAVVIISMRKRCTLQRQLNRGQHLLMEWNESLDSKGDGRCWPWFNQAHAGSGCEG